MEETKTRNYFHTIEPDSLLLHSTPFLFAKYTAIPVQIRIANIALFRFFLPFAATYFPRVCCHTFFAPVILRRKIIAGCHKKAFLQEWWNGLDIGCTKLIQRVAILSYRFLAGAFHLFFLKRDDKVTANAETD